MELFSPVMMEKKSATMHAYVSVVLKFQFFPLFSDADTVVNRRPTRYTVTLLL
jgi:hypothetical protein